MSDQLTHPAPAQSARAGRGQWLVPAVQAVTIVAVSAGLGILGGWLWERWWTPGRGIVYRGEWNKGLISLNLKTLAAQWSENVHQDVFSAVATYVVVAVVAGVLAGLLAALVLTRSEVVTLAALVVGGILGGTLIGVVGRSLGPADPNSLAPHTADGVTLPDDLRLTGTSWHLDLLGWHVAPNLLYLAFPAASLLVLVIVFLAFDRSRRSQPE